MESSKETDDGPSGEWRLFAHLMTNYNPDVRPVRKASSTITLKLGLSLLRIVELVTLGFLGLSSALLHAALMAEWIRRCLDMACPRYLFRAHPPPP